MKTVFNKTITLIERHSSYGSGDEVNARRKPVRASVSQPSDSLSVKAEAAGQRIDLMATVRRKDYSAGSFNYAEVDGVLYRIASANAAEKDLFVRLILERG